MVTGSIHEVEQDIRRGVRVRIDHIYFRDYTWQPHLEIQISVESVRKVPIRITAVDLFLRYQSQEVGPLPSLPRPYEVTEPDEGVAIRLRKDLYPTLVEDLKKGGERHIQVVGMIIIESPQHSGFMEYPVDETYVLR